MKNIILVLSLLCFSLQAQEKVFEIPKSFVTFQSKKKSYSLSNKVTNEIVLLLEEGKRFSAHLLDSSYNKKSEIFAKAISHKYTNLLGYNINANTYSVLYSNNTFTKFGIQTFDFDSGTSEIKILNFKIKGEKVIEFGNHNNKVYLIALTKDFSDLTIYTFDNSFTPIKNTISLKDLVYTNPDNKSKTVNVSDLLIPNYGNISNIHITKIYNSNRNNFKTTSKKTKLYTHQNKLIFSFDADIKTTRIFAIDLDTYKTELTSYNKSSNTEGGYTKSNSYIFDNKIFQISTSNQRMKFMITDLATQKLIKEYKATQEDIIKFKNSPIMLEKEGMFPAFSGNKDRGIEQTSKYLHKISSMSLGISAYKVDNQYDIVLGGINEIITNPTVSVGIAGVGVSVGIPTTKSTYINCVFDEKLNHIKGGKVKWNRYDKLYNFINELNKKTTAVTIFLHNNKLHYGFFDTKKRIYKLHTFED